MLSKKIIIEMLRYANELRLSSPKIQAEYNRYNHSDWFLLFTLSYCN